MQANEQTDERVALSVFLVVLAHSAIDGRVKILQSTATVLTSQPSSKNVVKTLHPLPCSTSRVYLLRDVSTSRA